MRVEVYDKNELVGIMEVPQTTSVAPEPWGLTQAHLDAAQGWTDWFECLTWALETQATVAELKAWHRAVWGEDLKEGAI